MHLAARWGTISPVSDTSLFFFANGGGACHNYTELGKRHVATILTGTISKLAFTCRCNWRQPLVASNTAGRCSWLHSHDFSPVGAPAAPQPSCWQSTFPVICCYLFVVTENALCYSATETLQASNHHNWWVLRLLKCLEWSWNVFEVCSEGCSQPQN